jgi:hypothetical protein
LRAESKTRVSCCVAMAAGLSAFPVAENEIFPGDELLGQMPA